MKKILTTLLFAIFAVGLIGCAPAEKSDSAPEPTKAAENTNSSTAENAPGTTPDGDTKGKSDADK